jgi:hypothetical protein
VEVIVTPQIQKLLLTQKTIQIEMVNRERVARAVTTGVFVDKDEGRAGNVFANTERFAYRLNEARLPAAQVADQTDDGSRRQSLCKSTTKGACALRRVGREYIFRYRRQPLLPFHHCDGKNHLFE